MGKLLRVEHVKKTFPAKRGKGSIHAVKNVSFSLDYGETLGITGPSGCGKTTLIKMILGLIKPDSGAVDVAGHIGFVPQNPYASLDPSMNVYKCIAEPLKFLNMHGEKNRESCSERVSTVMKQVRLDYLTYKDRLPSQLSGGERQRVAIARALVHRPDLIILDEPTSMIDQEVRQEITNLLSAIAANENRSFIMVTHDISSTVDICDNLIVMEDGKIVEQGNTEQILTFPASELTAKLTLAAADINAYWDNMKIRS